MRKAPQIILILIFLFLINGCANTAQIIKVEYMTPHGNELFYYGDCNEFDNVVDEVLVFSTLKNNSLLPVIPELEIEFLIGTSPPIYDDYHYIDMEKMQDNVKWTKVASKKIKKIRIFKPFETRKLLLTRLKMKEIFEKHGNENEYIVIYKTVIKWNDLKFEAFLDGYIGC